MAKKNNTGLPADLKSGIESLSGINMANVKVNHNLPQPAALNANALAQAEDIMPAPGQERHSAKEAWHVVQQQQGWVKTVKQADGKTIVDDNNDLEQEADKMGRAALKQKI